MLLWSQETQMSPHFYHCHHHIKIVWGFISFFYCLNRSITFFIDLTPNKIWQCFYYSHLRKQNDHQMVSLMTEKWKVTRQGHVHSHDMLLVSVAQK
jgi:hypothetical protein